MGSLTFRVPASSKGEKMSTLPRLERFPKGAYQILAPRLQGVKRVSAELRGWGKGWPTCQSSKMTRFHANRISRPIRTEVAELIEFLMKASNALGYDIRKEDEPDGGCGTFVCRAIKRSSPPVASNHSWGLAIDQNTKSNPMSKTWQSTTPPKIVDLWESAGWFWGGRYPATTWFYDAMHFEYMGRPVDVTKDLAGAKAAFKRLGGTTLYPTLKVGSTNRAMVRALQNMLVARGATLPEDGDFGATTETAVKAFQKSAGLASDGVVGSLSWTALNAHGTPDEPLPPDAVEPVEPTTDDLEAEIATLEQQLDVSQAEVASLRAENDGMQVTITALELKVAADKVDAGSILNR